jgi:Flp pilus assembly protein TadD
LARASASGRGSRWAEALASAQFFAELRKAQAQAEQDPAAAAAILKRLAAQPGRNRALAEQLLGGVLARQGRDAEAEGAYRAALAIDPANADALGGLFEALVRQNKLSEAAAMTSQLSAPDAHARLAAAEARVAHAQANQLWASGDLKGANAAFETALAADPADPWIRYDFARFLAGQGSIQAARGLISPLATARAPEALYAAALFANDQDEVADALVLISRIPAEARTAAMAALAEDLQARSVVAQARAARASGRTFEAAASLEALAARPHLGVAAQAELASGLYDLGDEARAVAIAEQALTSANAAAPAAYEGFVAVLAKAGRDAEAGALVRQLAMKSPPTVENRRALAALGAALAAERADRLRLSGDLAGAFDTLSAAFAVAPHDPRLLAALGRLYQSGHMPIQAQQAFEAVLQLKPGDPDALAGVADSALDRGDIARARAAVGQAIARRASDPELYLLSARVEQAAGDRSAALRALHIAQSLRQRQLAVPAAAGAIPGALSAAPGAGLLGPNPFAPQPARAEPLPAYGPDASVAAAPAVWAQPPAPTSIYDAPPAYPSSRPAPGQGSAEAPAGSRLGASGQDRITGEIQRRIAELSPDVQPEVQASADFRGRSGEPGLSRLDEISAKAAVTTPVFGVGQLTASVSPTALTAGTAGPDSRRRFGSGAIPDAQGGAVPAPGPQTASGAAVSLGYSIGGFAADVGTTPMGFGHTRAVGGVSYEQKLGAGVKARAFAERRAVTDSLTSYAGAKDPVSGAIWGEVMRETAGASLSYDTRAAGAYADGSASRYNGRGVPRNSSYAVNVGGYVRPYRTDSSRLQVGVNLNHQHYANDQNFFSLGHGGYFSPQQFTSVSLPVNFQTQRGRWKMELEAAPGYQTYTQDGAPYFPFNPALQSRLAGLAKAGVETIYPASAHSGFGGSGKGVVAYQIAPGATMGGEAGVNTFGGYNEAKLRLFLHVAIGGPRR